MLDQKKEMCSKERPGADLSVVTCILPAFSCFDFFRGGGVTGTILLVLFLFSGEFILF